MTSALRQMFRTLIRCNLDPAITRMPFVTAFHFCPYDWLDLGKTLPAAETHGVVLGGDTQS